jgi:hypothetical protein
VISLRPGEVICRWQNGAGKSTSSGADRRHLSTGQIVVDG